MKRISYIIIICITLLALAAWFISNSNTKANNITQTNIWDDEKISITELKTVVQNKDVRLVDSTNANERILIPGTDIQLPPDEYEAIEEYLGKFTDSTKVVFYDIDEKQSEASVKELRKRKHKNVFYIEGGITAWISEGNNTNSDLDIEQMTPEEIAEMMESGMIHFQFDPSTFDQMQKHMPQVKPVGEVTMAEVNKHNTLENCWIVLGDNVYEIPYYWTEMHPGGQEAFLKSCGKDASEDFAAHITQRPTDVLKYFLIGTLAK